MARARGLGPRKRISLFLYLNDFLLFRKEAAKQNSQNQLVENWIEPKLILLRKGQPLNIIHKKPATPPRRKLMGFMLSVDDHKLFEDEAIRLNMPISHLLMSLIDPYLQKLRQ